MPVAEILIGVVPLLVGIAALRWSWLRRGGFGGRLLVPGGWLLVFAGLVAFARAWGAEVGIAYGLLAFSVAAYGVVGAGVELRTARVRASQDVALEPEERPGNWRRGLAKALLAIVLAGVAAIGIGVAFAVAMPMAPQDRIVIGGILAPVLWGGGMAWTLSDARLGRATVLLLAVSVLSYGIAFLPKVLS